MAATVVADTARASGPGSGDLRRLTLAALGVVYGDIGTSPLYTIQQTFGEAGRLPLDEGTILGALSLVFWSLLLIVTVKYVALILRADNRGEGGVLALGTLAARTVGDSRPLQLLILALTLTGLSLFYGDGLITPAISVMSAIEGLETATPALASYVLPLSAVVLFGLFAIQTHGTGRVGALFGPVMLLWFAVLAVLGLAQVVQAPGVLRALDPLYGVGLFRQLGWGAFVALGAVVLAVTGAEALYADMGHFRKAPIRLAWLGLVLPALVLNYFGQGALLLRHPEAVDNPFYHLVPGFLLYPMVGLATAATVIASQAVISGVFSLTHQAIQLGNLPRMTVVHTSEREIGQIYVPRMNWLLMAGVLALVATFRSSGALASAYGVAVTGTMGASAVLAGLVAATCWGWGSGARRPRLRAPAAGRPHLPRRQLAEDPGGRLVPDRDRVGRRLRGRDLAARPGGAGAEAIRLRADHPELHRQARPEADAREGHGRIHDRQPRRRAEGAPPQPEAQQGDPRARGADDRPRPRRPARARGGAGRCRGDGAGLLARGRALRLRGRAGRAEGAGPVPGARAAGRPDADLVLPVAGDADPRPRPGIGPGRGAGVHGARRRRPSRHRLFPHPAGPGG